MTNPSELTNLSEVVSKIEELLVRAKELADEDGSGFTIEGADFYSYDSSDSSDWDDSWDDSNC